VWVKVTIDIKHVVMIILQRRCHLRSQHMFLRARGIQHCTIRQSGAVKADILNKVKVTCEQEVVPTNTSECGSDSMCEKHASLLVF
jgi:hypothetical protein